MMDLNATLPRATTQSINLSFTPEILASLIQRGRLHASDFNCLDDSAKAHVWQMLLASVAGPHTHVTE